MIRKGETKRSLRRLSGCAFSYALTILLAALFILVFAGGRSVRAQAARTLSQVKRVYIESFGEEDSATKLRERIIKQLSKTGRLKVVTTPTDADAVIKGSLSIWVAGYISTNLRATSSERQPIVHGFLSVEVVGKDNEPLWSYLVTPSKFRSGSIVDDLADQLVTKLVGSVDEEKEKVPASPATEQTGEMSLHGAGATFPGPLYQKWFESYQQRYPQGDISYNAVGSESGVQLLADGKADFAASDVPLSPEKMSALKTSILHFATVMGAVVPIYNLATVDRNLYFTPEALAGIYLGKIKKWSDPIIRRHNKGAALPANDITVVHRSDGSGTTFVWTDYLSKVSSDWQTAVGAGTVVKWPVGATAEGNEGVAAMVQQTPDSIGYVELVYALRHHLNFGYVRNAAGEFVQADLASTTAAGRSAAASMTSDFRVSITNASGKDAYPIATFTWWLWPEEPANAAKKPVFVQLLRWVLTSGQKECSALGYAPLPHEIASSELQVLTKLK